MFFRFAAGSFAVAVLAVCIPAADPVPASNKPLTPAEIESLIRQLGDEDFKTREAASAALKRRPEAALALLRAHREIDDPEAKERLAKIIPHMMSPAGAKKRLERLPDYLKNRQVDRAVETMVACRQFVTLRHRDLILEFAKSQFAEATKLAKKEMREPRISWKDQTTVFRLAGRTVYWRHPEIWFNLRTTDEGHVFEPFWRLHEFATHDGTGHGSTETTSIVRSASGSGGSRLVVAADYFEDFDGLTCDGIVIGNGDLKIGTTAGPNIFITTGNVSGENFQGYNDRGCVILCGGNFKMRLGLKQSVVFAGGRIEVLESWSEGNFRREQDKELIGKWKLYSATEAGATLKAMFGVVWVQAVAPESRFAKAGIKPGDVLARIDGTSIRTVRDANRLLCRATVSWGATDVSIVRDDKKRDVIIPLQEW